MAAFLIRDLVELPRVRTVIQLADVSDEVLARGILEDFILTADCDFALAAILDAMTHDEGQGFFLQGNFGSGKSHFLAFLELLFQPVTAAVAWNAVLEQNRRHERLRKVLGPAGLVVSVSLVEHTGSERLEDICLTALADAVTGPLGLAPAFAADETATAEIRAALEARHRDALATFLARRSVTAERLFDPRKPDLLDDLVRELDLPFRVRRERGAFFDALERELTKRPLLLLVDELSEFLRSKPDARAFNEDIRFLQFLGEASRRMRFVIVASLQEHIETTGEIDQTTFGKIKDRFPSRLTLSGTHLRQLASARLIKKKPGAEAPIADLYGKFRAAFEGLSLSREDFEKLYPVHPATIDLLDDLLPLFSRHRGAVDFLHYQLAGDPSRNIQGLLDASAETLLGPDAILDHFRVRVQETLETSPYITVVLAFYEKELSRLFAEPEDRESALRLVKILVLLAISPIRRKRRVSDLAEMLLKSITTLDSAANYDHVRDLLEKMRTDGAYLSVIAGPSPSEDVYTIDLAADVQLILKRRVESLLKDPGFTLARAVEKLLPFFKSPDLPLASLARSPSTERTVVWQKTRREGLLLFCRDPNDALLSEGRLDELGEKLFTTELDFCVVLMAPGGENLEDRDFERLWERGGDAFIVWVPGPLRGGSDAPEALIRRAAARLEVKAHYERDTSEVGKRVIDALEPLLREDVELTESLVARAYRRGRFLAPVAPSVSPNELPSLTFDRILARLAEFPLERRFPKHGRIASSLEPTATDTRSPLLREFFRAGEVPAQSLSEPLRMTLDSWLRPLGLVRRTPSGYRLQPDPSESELVRVVLERVGNKRVSLDDLYRDLRKGTFGLTRPSFELVVQALLYSGQINAYASGRKLSLDALENRAMSRIQEVGPGEMLSRELQSVLSGLPFVPPRLRHGAFGFAQQRALWDAVTEWKAGFDRRASGLKAELERARSYRAAAELDLDRIGAVIDRLESVASEIKVSYAAREGLERFARRAREEPDFGYDFQAFDSLSRFFREEWERYLFVQRYLNDPAMEIPAELEDLRARRDALRALAGRRDLPFDAEATRKLQEEMQAFIAAYGEAYEGAHRAEKSRERASKLLSLRDEKAYRLLQRLAAVELVSVDDDLPKVDRLLDDALSKTCNRLSPELLRSKPICDCGFQLGKRLDLPSTTEARAIVERGIVQYLQRLREPAFREPIESALHGLTEVGKNALVSKIRALIELDLDLEANGLLKRLDTLVTREVVDAVNDALSGHAVLVERRLDDLVERISERSFPRRKLLELIERWVDGGESLSPDDYIKVVSGAARASDESLLEAFIRKHDEGLVPWWSETGTRRAARFTVLAFRAGSGEAVEGLEARVAERLRSAFEAFVEKAPDDAMRVRDRVESELGDDDRLALLTSLGGSDDAAGLVQDAFRERAFRFIVRDRAQKLIRMVLSGASLPRLPERQPSKTDLDVGLDTLTRALESAETVTGALRHIEDRTGPPTSSEHWERLYREHMAPIPAALGDLGEAVEALKLADAIDLRTLEGEARRRLEVLSAAFETFLSGEASKEDAAMTMTRLGGLFGHLADKHRRKIDSAGERFVFLDGMRWDVWAHLSKTLLPRLRAVYRIVDEIPLWSVHPTTTEAQLRAAGIGMPELELVTEPTPGNESDSHSRRTRWERERQRQRQHDRPPLPGFRRLRGPNGEPIDRLNLVDDKIHESSMPLADLLREIELHARRSLGALLEETPPDTIVFLFSDHGFREDPRWRESDRHRKPRYRHGGASPWEVITPLAVLYRD